ncbi:MAG: hypothetical protein ACK5Y2_11165 [Bdellovibrionales bacterium]
MKIFAFALLAVMSSVSSARVIVEDCQVEQSEMSIQLVARANKSRVSKSSAMMESKMNGRSFVSTQDQATYKFFSGPRAAEQIRKDNFLNWMTLQAKASKPDIAKGVMTYVYGNPGDGGAGVALVVFQSLGGKRASFVFHGWAGFHRCE